VQLDLV